MFSTYIIYEVTNAHIDYLYSTFYLKTASNTVIQILR